jgi:glycosyltransferase involved in cell wall biosynthesis
MTDKMKWWRYRRGQRALRQLLVELQPDVIHANDLPTSQMIAQAAGQLGIPRLCHHRWIFGGAAIDWLNKFGAERHAFVSLALMDELCAESARLAASPRAVVYDGLPLPARPTDGDRLAAREALGVRADGPVVLFAGQIIERKGVADLLRAWNMLAAGPARRAELIIVGDDLEGEGRYCREMERLAAELGCGAKFKGFQRNVPEWLTAADLCVVPSHAEPLGNATLEAMAHARPVVGCRVGGIPEMVADGVTGLLVPPHDPPKLAAAIDRMLGDAPLRQRLGAAGRRRCEEQFSLQAHVDAVVDQYRTVLTSRATTSA